ncbi:hypothetical protein [Bifidobacterium sp. SO1]|uniref:hypothetical protein n=1 Tax=Bifidobacterium sp. SO1 TaxID=2809029 RepID=UPI001BDD1A74|nr:hypothetical protein [Bifidobacterium sp. SO1]MBT1162564.1 hypothetical protein [Bifidobacterium sp. SO1]
MTTNTLPKLTQAQWKTLIEYADINQTIPFPTRNTLNAFIRQGLVEAGGWINGKFTDKARQILEQVETTARNKGKLPKAVRMTLAVEKPLLVIDDSDGEVQLTAISHILRVDDDLMSRFAVDPRENVRIRMAKIATNEQTRFFDNEHSVDVLYALGSAHYPWLQKQAERFIESNDSRLHRLLINNDVLTREQLNRVIDKHLVDLLIVGKFYDFNEERYPERLKLTDQELTKILHDGTGDAQSFLLSRSFASQRLQNLIDDKMVDHWCENGDSQILEALIRRTSSNEKLTPERISMIVNRHIVDGILIQYLWLELSNKQIESMIRHAIETNDTDTLEQAGNMRRPFTHTMIRLLSGKSRIFDNRMQQFADNVNELFATPVADMASIINSYVKEN